MNTACLSLEEIRESLHPRKPPGFHCASALLADVRIAAECDDIHFFRDFFVMFGGPAPVAGRLEAPADIQVEIRAGIDPRFGWFRISGEDRLPVDGREFHFAVERDQGTFVRLPAEPGWSCFAFRGDPEPAFAFRERECIFSLAPDWRSRIAWFLFWRLLRSRTDAIFFHASSLEIGGAGTIFVGNAGAGKSTTALALASRGHGFLGDEVAGYLPGSGELIPVLRPVGIKRGRRPAAVDRGLAARDAERIEKDGFARIAISDLFPVRAARRVPLRRVVFLDGFGPQPRLERMEPGRTEIAALQPLMSNFLDASHSRRVFELARLLSSARVYRARLGDPDETAHYLEQEFSRQ